MVRRVYLSRNWLMRGTAESIMVVSVKTYEQLALEDPDGQWELECGRLRQKPGMTYEHSSTISRLAGQCFKQLEPTEFTVFVNGPRLRVSSGSYYIPDIAVAPSGLVQRKLRERRGQLDVYEEPLPLVVEVWSPSTGEYDVELKLREYQQRGDAEIWRVHPYERTVTAWRCQPDGSYSEIVYGEGSIEPAALPGVRIELATLFDRRRRESDDEQAT